MSNIFFMCIFVIFQIASLNKLENENQEAAKKLEQAIRKGGTRDMGWYYGYVVRRIWGGTRGYLIDWTDHRRFIDCP